MTPTEAAAKTFRQYRRSQIAELREYVPGEDMRGVSVAGVDHAAGSPKTGDMIARNPKNHEDQWLVAAQYFADNFEPLPTEAAEPGETKTDARLKTMITEVFDGSEFDTLPRRPRRMKEALGIAREVLVEADAAYANALDFSRMVINAADGDRLFVEGNIAAKDLLAARERTANALTAIANALQEPQP